MRVVIIGYGMAGSRLARELGRHGIDVTVFGAEPHHAYNRVLLSSLLAGTRSAVDIGLPAPPDHVDVRLGEPVTDIDIDARTVNGIGYDALVLATGAEALIPPVPGLSPLPDRVAVLRTLDDCARIGELASRTGTRGGHDGRAVVLGGGLLGLETARGLAGLGLDVTVVHAAGHLMERQLDPAAGGMLAATLASLGIATLTDKSVTQVVETAQGIELRDGDRVVAETDLLVVSCGVRPRTDLAQDAGLTVERGVVIDGQCRTSDAAVFAIGDCAQYRDQTFGLVAPAWEQADVVAKVLTGGEAEYRGGAPLTRLKTDGIDLAAMGTLDGDEIVSYLDEASGVYARLVIDADRLVGAVLLGDNPTVGQVTQLFDRGDPVPKDRRSLLLGRSFGQSRSAVEQTAAADTIVCRCNTVDNAALVRAFDDGARTDTELSRVTRAGTGCGGCVADVKAICSRLAADRAVAGRLTEVSA